MRFRDRRDAGRQLAASLPPLPAEGVAVLALPRGGVPVAAEVAAALGAPLDVFVARKVGAPGHREFGIGAIAEGGAVVADRESLRLTGVTASRFDELAAAERAELDRRVRAYRGERELPRAEVVVLVDDGLATGVTAEAAVMGLRRLGVGRVILAVPVGAVDSLERLARIADELVCPLRPTHFMAVGEWYADFAQTTDAEVLELLAPANPPT